MFKVIREEVPQPVFFMMCDEACSRYLQGPATGNPEDMNVQAAFVQEAAKQGWIVSPLSHLCPLHAQKRLQQLAQSRRLVELASSVRDTNLRVLKN